MISKIPIFVDRIHPGDQVVFQNPEYGILIKSVERFSLDGELVFVSGSHPSSLDSRRLGPIAKKGLLGKVLWHIRKSVKR